MNTNFDGPHSVLMSHPRLSREEEVSLGKASLRGDLAARQRLVLCNMRLVARIASIYSRTPEVHQDLVADGAIAIMKAAAIFDPEKGRFSCFAGPMIRHAVQTSFCKNHLTVHSIPTRLLGDKKIADEETVRLTEMLGRMPNEEEVAYALQWGSKRIQRQSLASGALSLDGAIEEGNSERTLADIVAMDRLDIERKSRRELSESLNEALSHLPERTREVIVRRYGMDGGEPETLREISDRFKVSVERVRQLEEIGMRRIRQEFDRIRQYEPVAREMAGAFE